jgi:hypothetical protein
MLFQKLAHYIKNETFFIIMYIMNDGFKKIQKRKGGEMTNYELYNLVINTFIALGTCGAVVFAIIKSLPIREKVKGSATFYLPALKGNKQVAPYVDFVLVNCKDAPIEFNYKAGITIQHKDRTEIIELNNKNDNGVFVSGRATKPFRYYLTLRGDKISLLLTNKDCQVFVYTSNLTKVMLEMQGIEKD